MLKAKVSSSIEKDEYTAGKNMIDKITKDLSNIKVCFVFTSDNKNIKNILDGINYKKKYPIIGCTTGDSIVTNEGIIQSENGFSAVLSFSDNKMKIGIGCARSGNDPRIIGRKVALQAIENAQTTRAPAYIYMVASPKEEEEYMLGIEDIVGRVPIFGGSASDTNMDNKWKIFTDDKIIEDGIAVAFFYTDNEIVTTFTGDYKETDNIGIITDVDNKRTLVSIDGISALRKYANWIKISPQKLKGENILNESVTKPLAVRDASGNIDIIKYPVFVNDMGTKTIMDDTIRLGNKVIKGTSIIQMISSKKDLINSPIKILTETQKKIYSKPAAYILIHCAARKKVIENELPKIYEQIKNQVKDVPFIMPFTFGQYGYEEHSSNICGGLMLSFTIFGEN